MHLKIFCDGSHPYRDDICRFLFNEGYPVEILFLGNYKPKDDGFYKHCSRSLKGDFVSLSFCESRNFNKNLSAKNSIAYLVENDFDFNQNLTKTDLIWVFNSFLEHSFSNHGFNSALLKPFCRPFEHRAKNTGAFSYYMDLDWSNKKWKEVLVAYCRAFSHDDKVSLTISSNENYDKVNRDIEIHLKVNGFHRDTSPQIVVFNRGFEKSIDYANVYISIGDQFFDRNVLDCMASGVPVGLFEDPVYSDFCKNNSCWIFRDVGSMEKFFATSYANKKILDSKSKFAKEYVLNNFSKSDFFKQVTESIEKFGVKSVGRFSLPMTEAFSDMEEMILL